MDAQHFFLEQHQITAGVVEQFVLGGVADDDWRRRPNGEQNPLAWLLWHAARWEDVIVNAWILPSRSGVRQPRLVVATGRCHPPRRDRDDVSRGERTRRAHRPRRAATVLAGDGGVDRRQRRRLPDTVLGDTVGVEQLEGGAADGAFRNERAGWMDQFWADHTVSWFLAFLNLHAAEHLLGEALVTRSQLLIPLGL